MYSLLPTQPQRPTAKGATPKQEPVKASNASREASAVGDMLMLRHDYVAVETDSAEWKHRRD